MSKQLSEVEEAPDLELITFEKIRSFNPITTRRGWILFFVWFGLMCLTFIPWPWFFSAEPYVFGWLPFPLLYFWLVELLYIGFIAYVGVKWAERKIQARESIERSGAGAAAGGED